MLENLMKNFEKFGKCMHVLTAESVLECVVLFLSPSEALCGQTEMIGCGKEQNSTFIKRYFMNYKGA